MTDTINAADIDILGFGNAIIDVLASADDAFLAEHNIAKGGMMLIDEPEAAAIYGAMASSVEISGGSVANSIACVASFGGKGAFTGKVAADALGETYRNDLRSLGVVFDTAPLADGPGTGRCLINVTPDAQRSMSTFLGAAGYVGPLDVDNDLIERAAITFFEGYLFEPAEPRKAFEAASAVARQAGRQVAMTLSDSGVVDRQFDALKPFIENNIDILLANDAEAAALFGSSETGDIADKAREICALTAITHSEKGSVLIPRDGAPVIIDAVKPAQLIDTTGAGDAYAAGLLWGLSNGFPLERAGALGSLAAAEVISHFGARPEEPLKDLAKKAGLL
ncbi:MAG: adenosine kinase [Pseudomonadota bacterium]